MPADARNPRRLIVIFNPTAGRGKRPRNRLRRVLVELERLGCSVVVRATQAPGDAERWAREADASFDLVVAAGGDGTVNEIVNGLSAAPRPFAVIPLGTANVLANEIGLPRRPRQLAAAIAFGTPRPVWPGRVAGRLFVMMAGVGFDAELLCRLDKDLKRRVGKLAFVWPLLVCLCRYRPHEFIVRADGKEYRVASAVAAKGHFYAGRFVLAPEARIADPVFHVVLFGRAGRSAALCYLAAMMLGMLHRLPNVTIVTARTVSLAGVEPGFVQADGEIVAPLPVAIELAPEPLLLVQPA